MTKKEVIRNFGRYKNFFVKDFCQVKKMFAHIVFAPPNIYEKSTPMFAILVNYIWVDLPR